MDITVTFKSKFKWSQVSKSSRQMVIMAVDRPYNLQYLGFHNESVTI